MKPHLFDGELGLLQTEMAQADSYLEFGMGGSTLLAAANIGRIVSVDSDPDWVRRVKEMIPSRPGDDKISLIHCDIGAVGPWGYPINRDRSASWPRYFIEPWEKFLSNREMPDLIYVDGRFRVACILYSLFCIRGRRWSLFRKRSRIAVHDFFDRPHYQPVLKYAQVVARNNTLGVLEPRRDACNREIVRDILSFQHDVR